jgi:hypothetical protein
MSVYKGDSGFESLARHSLFIFFVFLQDDFKFPDHTVLGCYCVQPSVSASVLDQASSLPPCSTTFFFVLFCSMQLQTCPFIL